MTSNSRVLVVLGVLIGLTGLGELVWAVLAHHPSGGANIGAGIAALGALAGLVAFASGILLGWLPPTTSGGEAVVLVGGVWCCCWRVVLRDASSLVCVLFELVLSLRCSALSHRRITRVCSRPRPALTSDPKTEDRRGGAVAAETLSRWAVRGQQWG